MRVIISGGGTGGHIYPALSLIKEMKKCEPNAEFLYIGTKNGLESSIVPREDIPFRTIHITGFKRKLSLENIRTVMRFLKGVPQSKKMIRDFKPDVVIGTGGYVCGPVVYAAAKLNVPTIVHEQNSVPGLTNKFLSRYVTKVAISFEESETFLPKEKIVYTGNPRASEAISTKKVDRLSSMGLNPRKKTVLIVGGSRGAKPINDMFIQSLKEAAKRNYQFLYVTGDAHYDHVLEQVKKLGNPANVRIEPFVHNMPEVLKNVDLIIARAGATTLAEITALGLPSVLIPSPYVTNNHQEKNAQALAKNSAATIIREAEINKIDLLAEIDKIILNEQKWNEMKQAALMHGKPNAALDIYELIKRIVAK